MMYYLMSMGFCFSQAAANVEEMGHGVAPRPGDELDTAPSSDTELQGFDDFRRRYERIHGGRDAGEGEVPFQVSLRWMGESSMHFCGGTLIAERWVLTAAHCLKQRSGHMLLQDHQLFVRVGGWTLRDEGSKGDVFTVKRQIVHPQYRNNGQNLWNDVALIELAEPATGHATVRLAREEEVYDWMGIATAGWGFDEHGKSPNTLQILQDIRVIPIQTCADNYEAQSPYRVETDGSMVCAGTLAGRRDACRGDSGGPLYRKVDGEFVQMGITSWGDGCGKVDLPGLYASVPTYTSWIMEYVTAQSCAGPTDQSWNWRDNQSDERTITLLSSSEAAEIVSGIEEGYTVSVDSDASLRIQRDGSWSYSHIKYIRADTGAQETFYFRGGYADHTRVEIEDGNKYIVTPKLTWEDAEAYCVENGGHLASIHSAQQDARLLSFAKENTSSSYPWLGGYSTSANTPGTYKWTDGSAWDYYNARWKRNDGHPNYVHLYRNNWWQWGTWCPTCKAEGICAIPQKGPTKIKCTGNSRGDHQCNSLPEGVAVPVVITELKFHPKSGSAHANQWQRNRFSFTGTKYRACTEPCAGLSDQSWSWENEYGAGDHKIVLLSETKAAEIASNIKDKGFKYSVDTDVSLYIRRDDSWSESYFKYIRTDTGAQETFVFKGGYADHTNVKIVEGGQKILCTGNRHGHNRCNSLPEGEAVPVIITEVYFHPQSGGARGDNWTRNRFTFMGTKYRACLFGRA